MRKPNIIHIVGSLYPGGVQRLLLGLFQSRAFFGFKHSIICTTADGGSLKEQFMQLGVQCETCLFEPEIKFLPYRVQKNFKNFKIGTFTRRLKKALSKLNADIVHTHISAYPHFQAKAVLENSPRAWVWTLHGLYELSKSEQKEWKNAAALAGPDRFFLTSDSRGVSEYFESADFFNEAGINKRIVYPGANVPVFNENKDSVSFRSKWKIKEGAVLFCSVGRLVHVKGLDVLIKASKQLAQRSENFHFMIVGDGGQKEQLRTQVCDLGMSSFFTFAGYQENPEHFLREADVFVIPSRSEGFPLSLIEALGMGLPSIGSKVGGIPEILDDRGGLLVSPENTEELAVSLGVMMDPSERKKYAGGCCSIARKFSFDECAQNYKHIYEGLLAKRVYE